MFRNLLNLAVFVMGLAAVCWVGVGYIGSNPLGAAVALLIGACYVAGALELHRYRQATATLGHAVAALSATPPNLAVWLDRLHPSVRHAVRLRVEGERVALPAPALTPYLVGLLVLLGMLGTLLGMMATLHGTGMALESATDLQAIRGSLAAPVKGLGFAFGTSIAGVASSAMLGLLSALCRRERLHVVHALDATIATTLHVFSQAHQRDEAFMLLQQQTASMPVLVDRLQAMMATIEQQSLAANEQQRASHVAFHASTGEVYARLASSVETSLKESVAESARAASGALQPVVDATMAGLAREAEALHAAVTQAVQKQLDVLTAGFDASTTRVASLWTDALAEHRRANEAQARDLRASLDGFNGAFEDRSSQLMETVATRFDAASERTSAAWTDALAQQTENSRELALRHEQAMTAVTASFEEHAGSLVRVVQTSHDELQATLAANDEQRLHAWTKTLAAMATELGKQWEQAGEHTAGRQKDICDALEKTANDMSVQTQAHATATIAEISRLVEAASEAPRVAAEVVAELRQKLSESMVRDTAMLDERSRLLATLETLLDAVNHASTEQRVAVDSLITTSADLLDRVGTRFTSHVEAETGKLGGIAAQMTGNAVEVARLAEAFGAGVQLFGQSNEALMERLDRVATALDNSLIRSDEQLAYYVAQAREVVDLSVLSQKQIIEDLQHLAAKRTKAKAETA